MRENGAVAFTSGVLRVKIRLQAGPVMRAFDDDDDDDEAKRCVPGPDHSPCRVHAIITASKRPISDRPASFRHNTIRLHAPITVSINIKRVPLPFLRNGGEGEGKLKLKLTERG